MKLGDCYEAAVKYVLYKDPKAIMVHGLPILSTDGKPFGHAWVEKGRTCIDVANGNHTELPKILYYRLGHISDKVYEYTVDQIQEKIMKTGNWGPWELNPPR